MLFVDTADPSVGVMAAGAGIVFLIILAAVAFLAFRLFRRTLKMAFRMAMLATALVAVLVGSVGLWWYGSSKPGPRPATPRNR